VADEQKQLAYVVLL